MPHIFRFHKGVTTDILDWKPSQRILSGDLLEVTDKTDVVTSAAGSSIPTPVARMFLFKTAFELMALPQGNRGIAGKGIYAALVSQALDLLELLYSNGSDPNQFRYEKWAFDGDDTGFFGSEYAGHKLLTESFRHAAGQAPFNGSMEITLIYYREGAKEVLIGGTSPFTLVFTSPNFIRKHREKAMKNIDGLTSDRPLFSAKYTPLQERDPAFIAYLETLVRDNMRASATPFVDYVFNTRSRFEHEDPERFHAPAAELQEITFGADIPLTAAGIHIRQISARDYQAKISRYSDFKLDLPEDSPYTKDRLPPLFLNSNMDFDGQYTSPTNNWSNKTIINELAYGHTTADLIQTRLLPGLKGVQYPFVSKFDFFEKSLVTLPGYVLNDERFVTLIENQNFLLPLKPLFFQFFPLKDIGNYVEVSRVPNTLGTEPEISVKIRVRIDGPTMNKRVITISQVYKRNLTRNKEDEGKYGVTDYRGILGVFPFIKTEDTSLKYINNYTVASYEKTNDGDQLVAVGFLKKEGEPLAGTQFSPRSEYKDVNTRTGYYQVKESFDIIQLRFVTNGSSIGGLIVPEFKTVSNGTDRYVYGIDFGTSNTHIEYSRIENNQAVSIRPFEINEAEQKNMAMTMLSKPVEVKEQDGAVRYDDYTRFGGIVDSVTVIAQREFAPFQIGSQKGATVKFPFRTATFESRNFKETKKPLLFAEANIGFNIDRDILVYNQGYQTDIKWQLETDLNDSLRKNRVKLFFRQLLLMIRSHALLISAPDPASALDQLKIAMSYPTSMDPDLKKALAGFFEEEMNDVFNICKPDSAADNTSSENHRLIEVTESIAPYYQLLKADKNIQHNIYCNIDVGGGTSDIVLVNNVSRSADRVLNCFCNSVKFAGKQLWGSVSDDYDPTDNGFVLFYLRLLQSRNPLDYDKLQKMIGARNNRTEDIVSYLFYDEAFDFKQIFTECKELKVPLLLHYTALLYFVAKSCKSKTIDLPKTLSFSGKGSEYIHIIFASEEHLRIYTRKALVLFSGLRADPEFKIRKSSNPKVITAQGSVIYGAKPLKRREDDIFGSDTVATGTDELEIKTITDSYSGLREADDDGAIKTYADFLEPGAAFSSVMMNCVDFLESFFNDKELMQGSEMSLNINNLSSYRSFFLGQGNSVDVLTSGVLRNSYKSALEQKNMKNKVSDSPFFFAFDTALIELSKHIANNALIAKSL
jgi:hypothetical protein